MTFAEFELLPEIDGKRELVDGEVAIMPPPELAHSRIAKRILLLFLARLDQSRVWPDHTGYRIAQGWIEPDVSVTWPDQRRDEKYFVGSPMIAVEILSPGEEIDRKLTLYFADGGGEVWVVDAERESMTVYSQQNGQVTRCRVEREYRSEAAQTIFSLADLTQTIDQPAPEGLIAGRLPPPPRWLASKASCNSDANSAMPAAERRVTPARGRTHLCVH